MKKFSIVGLLTICTSLYPGFMKNRLQEIEDAKEKCLRDKIQCGARAWNIVSNWAESDLGKKYSFDIKPEVAVIYRGVIYPFSATNVNRPVARDTQRNMPIHYVAANGDVGDLKTLLAWGADINSKNKYDETPLIKAAQSGNFHVVAYLLENDAQITQSRRPFEDFNPFHYALLLPKRANEKTSTVLKIVQALLNKDSDRLYLNKTSRKGTPLETAISEQLDPQVINFLLLQGAQITPTAKKGAAKLGSDYADVKKKIMDESQ